MNFLKKTKAITLTLLSLSLTNFAYAKDVLYLTAPTAIQYGVETDITITNGPENRPPQFNLGTIDQSAIETLVSTNGASLTVYQPFSNQTFTLGSIATTSYVQNSNSQIYGTLKVTLDKKINTASAFASFRFNVGQSNRVFVDVFNIPN